MNRKKILTLTIGIALIYLYLPAGEKNLEIKLSNSTEIGRDNLLFGIVAGVCEDDQNFFYVLDRSEHKVFKFSCAGKLQHTFGNKGEGPGDFQDPNRIAFTPQGKIIVANDLFYLSFFEQDGTFIERLHFNGRLTPGYIGDNCYYAWIWRTEDKQQVILDRQNNILRTFYHVKKDAFSASAPDSSGRAVMFTYAPDVYAPALVFSQFGKYAVIAKSDSYDFPILDPTGQEFSRIVRDIQPDRLSSKEKDYFEEDIRELSKKRGRPARVVRDTLKKIPKEKNYFDQVLLSGQHVFVCRIKSDITQADTRIPMDLFTLQGRFLGSTALIDKPIYISYKYMYFLKSDDEGNFYLVRMDYRIIT